MTLQIFDQLYNGLMYALGTETNLAILIGCASLIVFFMIGYEPLLAMIFGGIGFVFVAAAGYESYGVLPIVVLLMAYGVAVALSRLFFR